MVLTRIAILAVKGCKGIIPKIAAAANVSDSTVYTWIQNNSDNLTKAGVTEVIRQETGLTDEQILEKETANNG